MRPTLRSLCLAAMVALAGCESATEPAYPDGRLSGYWGGSPFEGNAIAEIRSDTLRVYGATGEGPEASIGVSLMVTGFTGPGDYALREGVVRYVIGGDGITATYTVPSEEAGVFRVTAVQGRRVMGRVSFAAYAWQGHGPLGTRAAFTGDFEAVVQLRR